MESSQMQSSRKRFRDDDSDEVELELAEVKRLRDDLFGVLDDSEPDSVSDDLDSVMRSFQDEISAPSTSAPLPPAVIDLTSDSGDSPAELGYLLEASDDELGLPPSTAASGDEVTELVRDRPDSAGIGELWGFFGTFDDQVPSYDSLGFDGEYGAAFDEGLFGFSDICFDPSEVSDFSWRSETMPAQ